MGRVSRELAKQYGRNDRFPPGSIIVCNCGRLKVERKGDVYICEGSYYVSQYFIMAKCCDDKIRYEPEVIGREGIKGNQHGTRRILW